MLYSPHARRGVILRRRIRRSLIHTLLQICLSINPIAARFMVANFAATPAGRLAACEVVRLRYPLPDDRCNTLSVTS
jgi:hypothetical protein